MQITKNQHYVPQCLLKFFSWEDKKERKTNVFDIPRYSFRYSQSIKKICSQNYFYDTDNMVENILSQKIEAPTAPLISSIVHHDTTVLDSSENWIRLLIFVSTLLSRTPKVMDRMDSIIQTNIQSISRELLRLNGMDSRNADGVKLKIDDEAPLISLLTLQGYFASILLTDLKFHLAINKTALDFFISDHPVFMYNWLYRDLDHPGITGFGTKGLQLFLPLSPRLMLCLYDPEIYRYGSKYSLLTDVHDVKDVGILNSFQAINSKSFVVFLDRKSETNIKSMLRHYGSKTLHMQKSIEYEVEVLGNETVRTRHIVYSKQLKIGVMPSFVNVKRKADNSVYGVRNPEAFEYFSQLTQTNYSR
ncbi:DUF4238 domain-containing protein [Candidatus Synechococcus calcipolaris G9]|uniref:DUF4238 domain-containing protein n=1 Tax=Candidatus Synechococcus calcipolaris G9 TaxID=1497997 RepID=A0ABT6EYS6_9SYNE|nr:DUF4238 domain-containing protein [Candidatus Synechococcus calcipolaris]MDG2990486.1 DUF4238 domain-containing protein [Candidatus Synechococcus calcipolaris G9]